MKPLLGLFRRKPHSAPVSTSPQSGKRYLSQTYCREAGGDGIAVMSNGAVANNALTSPVGGVQDGGRAAGATGTGSATAANGSPVNGSAATSAYAASGTLSSVSGVRNLPRPALRWLGAAGRIALREFDFEADSAAVCSFQEETYSLNFPDFRYNHSFAAAFRHDLRRAALDPQHALFVLDEGEVVGFLWLVICQNTWTGERYGYVNNLFIKDARRGQGLAREMMQQADVFFRSRRIKRVRLTVTASNAPAAHLYAQSGYTTTRWEMEKEL
ncbi:MAG: GNAT family N-acetyltransferase [Abitibacteriaceae bacterium]|nr:GNAT family N-acetyltransferase [Abditibacteriaceae bacterium]MBV9866217.1 GNAT family N-acetyltransferase [Abditibacteriaceae bacterium]